LLKISCTYAKISVIVETNVDLKEGTI